MKCLQIVKDLVRKKEDEKLENKKHGESCKVSDQHSDQVYHDYRNRQAHLVSKK